MGNAFLTSDAFALIASSFITAVVTIFVTVYTLRRATKPVVKKQAGEDVYKAWLRSLRTQLDDMQRDFDIKSEKFHERIDALEAELDESKRLNTRRLNKLLAISRQYNVDISDVV